LFDEVTLLDRLSDQQSLVVGEVLEQAARGEAISQENARLARELAGSIDRIQEIHHRIRNHLQTVTGLLSAEEIGAESPTARRALQKSIARLTSIAAIHDLLARDPDSGGLCLPDLAERLAHHLVRQADADERVRVRLAVADIQLPPRAATALVLILTELLSNAVEHGFPDGRAGEITVRAEAVGKQAELEVRDDGCGLPEGIDLARLESLGLRLVGRLTERDLGGAIEVGSETGTCFRVRFPIHEGQNE
jgi:two-component sensor histidine kinase